MVTRRMSCAVNKFVPSALDPTMARQNHRMLDVCVALACDCERFASSAEMGVAVVERLRPFGYVGAASGRLGLSGRLSALHFANWHPDWRAQYEKNGYLRIDPVPNWAAAC